MATNDIHVTVSDNNVSAPLTISGGTSLRSVSTDSGSPYYVGARAYVTQTENGATITVIDREGTTTATVLNGTNGVDGRDGVDGVDGVDGIDGVDGVGITSITQNVDGTLTILLDDGSSYITEPLKGEDGQDGQDGADGFSPIASVSKVGDTATISITDINGTTTASISDGTDGADGQDGADGADGYSPTATVTKSGDTATISITDKNGTPTASVSDGTDGVDGQDGRDGTDGVDGEDGNGIVSITKTATVGLVDTYTILFTNGTTTTFNVTNGQNGSGSVVDVWVDGTSVLDGDTAKIDLTGKADIDKGIPFGVCSTAKATVQKEVTINGITALEAGVAILVKFTATNTATNPTLKVNALDAKGIMRYGTTTASTSTATSWNANSVNLLVYDGTYWQMADWNNTTYSAMSQAEMEAGTATTGRNITAQRLKQAIEYHESPTPENLSDLNNDMVVSDFTNDAGYITGYTETDPTVPSWAKASTKPTYTASEVGAQETLVSGTNIKTINNTSLLGSGDITVASSGTSVPTADEVAEFDSTAHMNSTDMTASEVSDFVDSLAGQGANLADYVVEQGTSGIWIYRKWSSGIAEAWAITNTVSYAMTNAVGGNGYATDYWSLPSGLFTSITTIDVNRVDGGSGLVSFSVYSSSTTQFNYYVWIAGTTATVSMRVGMNVKGRWK